MKRQAAALGHQGRRLLEIMHEGGQALDRRDGVAGRLPEPRLLQRPIVVRGARAVIARPAERALDLLA